MEKMIVGLGNPGREYEMTRHNIGFLVIDEILRRSGKKFRRMLWIPARQARCSIKPIKARIIEPHTFMNQSGKAVLGAMKKWKIAPENILVVYDDIELDFGAVKVRKKGSGGSHNGMKSVSKWLRTNEFPRLRVGIGPRPEKVDLIDFVLGRFTEEESLRLEKVVNYAADAVESVFSMGTEQAMNTFNRGKIELS